MYKTYSINLGGSPFIINDDAYELLSQYIANLHASLDSMPDGSEIVNDIEIRISEILNEETAQGTRIVALNHIQDVIEQIGNPCEFTNYGEYIRESRNTTPPPPPVDEPMPNVPPTPQKKQLQRNLSNKILGGVCSGMAAYWNIDVVWIRLIWVAAAISALFNDWFFISFGTVILAYIVFWIVIPPGSARK